MDDNNIQMCTYPIVLLRVHGNPSYQGHVHTALTALGFFTGEWFK